MKTCLCGGGAGKARAGSLSRPFFFCAGFSTRSRSCAIEGAPVWHAPLRHGPARRRLLRPAVGAADMHDHITRASVRELARWQRWRRGLSRTQFPGPPTFGAPFFLPNQPRACTSLRRTSASSRMGNCPKSACTVRMRGMLACARRVGRQRSYSRRFFFFFFGGSARRASLGPICSRGARFFLLPLQSRPGRATVTRRRPGQRPVARTTTW